MLEKLQGESVTRKLAYFAFLNAIILAVVLSSCKIGGSSGAKSNTGGGVSPGKIPGSSSKPNQTWPVEIKSDAGAIQIFKPQPESLQGNQLKGSAAVSDTPSGGSTPIFGIIFFNATLEIDPADRSYGWKSINITKVKFPSPSTIDEHKFALAISHDLPGRNLRGSLDDLQLSLAASRHSEEASAKISNTPPKIIFVNYPAVLVLIDGTPTLQPIEGLAVLEGCQYSDDDAAGPGQFPVLPVFGQRLVHRLGCHERLERGPQPAP